VSIFDLPSGAGFGIVNSERNPGRAQASLGSENANLDGLAFLRGMSSIRPAA
jgi:hypothetical protein